MQFVTGIIVMLMGIALLALPFVLSVPVLIGLLLGVFGVLLILVGGLVGMRD